MVWSRWRFPCSWLKTQHKAHDSPVSPLEIQTTNLCFLGIQFAAILHFSGPLSLNPVASALRLRTFEASRPSILEAFGSSRIPRLRGLRGFKAPRPWFRDFKGLQVSGVARLQGFSLSAQVRPDASSSFRGFEAFSSRLSNLQGL